MSDDLTLIDIDLSIKNENTSIQISPNDILEYNPNQISEDAKSSNTSYKYSGRHDDGLLPNLNSTGKFALLCGALYKAKSICDELLTAEINNNAVIQNELTNQENPQKSRKKMKHSNSHDKSMEPGNLDDEIVLE
jgi:hypothetical protein